MLRRPGTPLSDIAAAGIILLLGLLLLLSGQFLDAERDAGTLQALPFDRLLAVTTNVLGLIVVTWWVLSGLVALLAAALHKSGKLSDAGRVAKYSPGFMFRLACALLTVNLLGAATAHAEPLPAPGWQPPGVSPPSAPWHPSTHPAEAQWKPRSPVVETGLLGRSMSRMGGAASPKDDTVVVQAGDSLWSIAARRCGPMATDLDVAMAWPRWYAANRGTIGDNPAVLRPGQVLQPPTD